MFQRTKKKVTRKIVIACMPLLVALLLLLFAVGGTNYVVDNVKDFINTFGEGVTGFFKQDIKLWTNSLTEEDIQRLLDSGVGVHPKKFVTYIDYEEKTVPQNTMTKSKLWKQDHLIRYDYTHDKEMDRKTKHLKGTLPIHEFMGKVGPTILEDYELLIGDTSNPYRVPYEAFLGVDFNNSTSEKEKDLTILDEAFKTVTDVGLTTDFDWSFEYVPTLTDTQLLYDVDYETFQYNETVWESFHTKTIYSGGPCADNFTEEKQEDFRYEYPLPYLNNANSMFKDYKFSYERVVLQEGEWEIIEPYPEHKSYTFRCSHGEEGSHTVTQYMTIYRQKRKRIEKDVPLPTVSTPNDNFMNFLKKHRLYDESDIHLMLNIVRELPETQRFAFELMNLLKEHEFDLGRPKGDIYASDFNLPDIDGEWTREDLMNVATSLLHLYGVDKPLHYFWAGKYGGIGFNEDWGTLKYEPVHRKAYVPYGMDCSGYTTWVYNQMLLPQNQKPLIGGSVNQHRASYYISRSQLKPGDLAFYTATPKSISGGHVGMYLGKHQGNDVFIHAGGSGWKSNGYPAGQVVITYNQPGKFLNGFAPSRFAQFRRLNIRFKGD